jgi:hypothetical protein
MNLNKCVEIVQDEIETARGCDLPELAAELEGLLAHLHTHVKVLEWAEGVRQGLDLVGPHITTADGEYMDVSTFEDLEEILGPDPS